MLASHDAFGLTTFAGNILTMLAIAAATDYGIFIFGRYREARGMGQDRDDAYYTTFKSVAPVIVGSGLTIAGATYCLSFARLPYFSTMGAPVAIGMVVVVAIAVTLGPAVLFLGSRIGLFESKRPPRSRFWRRVGTAVVRWPAPIFVASLFVVLIGIVAIPGYKPAYNDRYYMPADAPTNIGFAAADRHFSQARMNPDILMVNADHDMRNPADMLVLNAVARNVMHTEGIAMVQNITRPLGIPIQHSSIPFQTSVQGQTSNMNLPFQRDQLANQLKTIDATNVSIDILEKQYQLSLEQTKLTQDSAAKSQELLETTEELRDNIANFDDQFRPLRNYFYWEPHCFDIPLCAATTVPVRCPRRDRPSDRPDGCGAGQHRPTGGPRSAADRTPSTDDRVDEDQQGPVAGVVQLAEGPARPDGGHQRHRPGDGPELRPGQERRPVLSAPGGLPEPRLQTRSRDVPVAGRQVRSHVHHPRERSRDGRRASPGSTPNARPRRRP